MTLCHLIVHAIGATLCLGVIAATVFVFVDAIRTVRKELRS